MKTGIERVDNIINMQYGISLESEIGRGKYGVVYMGKEQSTGKYKAIKVISLPNRELEEQLRDTYGDNDEKIEDGIITHWKRCTVEGGRKKIDDYWNSSEKWRWKNL